jgi:predicted small lipoprotein YifL
MGVLKQMLLMLMLFQLTGCWTYIYLYLGVATPVTL